MLNQIEAGVLSVAYQEFGDPDGTPVILLHGFPYDIHSYQQVAPQLAEQHCRVIVPYLRGYGTTRFLSAETPRSGQQAVLADDLRALMDALAIPEAVLAGYDWGGRAACIVAALWPERLIGLVTGNGYNIQDIAGSVNPDRPENEWRFWYQYYFHGERGRAGLEQNRAELCRLLWRLWSPDWVFDDQTYQQTATAFDNPDFVEVVIHSYRHRYGLVAGDPAVKSIEQQLAALPPITVPTVSIDGKSDGVITLGDWQQRDRRFSGPYRHLTVDAGHNLPQEVPELFAEAVLSLCPSVG